MLPRIKNKSGNDSKSGQSERHIYNFLLQLCCPLLRKI